MSTGTILIGVFIAIGFALWPILGKYSGATGGWLITVVAAGTMFISPVLSVRELQNVPSPGIRAIALLFLAGMINGLACLLYSGRIAVMDSCYTATFVGLVTVAMLILAPVLNWFFNGNAPSQSQLIGFVLASLSVYFLVK
jgi:hypothetical protein